MENADHLVLLIANWYEHPIVKIDSTFGERTTVRVFLAANRARPTASSSVGLGSDAGASAWENAAMAHELMKTRGAFPHLRQHGGLVYVSGTSARQADNTIAGASADELGTLTLDMSIQARAVLDNIEKVLDTVGLDRSDLLDTTVFLVNMNDFVHTTRPGPSSSKV